LPELHLILWTFRVLVLFSFSCDIIISNTATAQCPSFNISERDYLHLMAIQNKWHIISSDDGSGTSSRNVACIKVYRIQWPTPNVIFLWSRSSNDWNFFQTGTKPRKMKGNSLVHCIQPSLGQLHYKVNWCCGLRTQAH